MNEPHSRRRFLAGSSLTAAALLLPESPLRAAAQDPVTDAAAEAKAGVTERVLWQAAPFPLQSVKLLPGIFRDQMETNSAYLHSLDSDSLLHSFRLTAGLPSKATPYGGWEAPDCELRGHFNGGHYLSACALTYASSGDQVLKQKADGLVAELARCQAAHASGYLSAFPEDFFDRLRKGEQVWAPYYTLHKIMAACSTCMSIAEILRPSQWPRAWPAGSASGPRASATITWRAS